ncbi:MAG: T9SS type A sorting domain-containing protein [Bacteroidia bacterium]|nr:T9SS type A sorting domain-containing protein [Bacteroidia bacterium]
MNNIPAGSYLVTITDANGCTATASKTITQSSLITTSLTGINVLCYGASTGSINLTVNGGNPPYTYLWSNSPTTGNLNNIPAGNYIVTVTDANGCPVTASKTITQPTQITTSVTGINILCNGTSTGSIDLTVSGGTTPYAYLWSNGPTTEDLNNLPAGSYLVTVTDANGCLATASKTLSQPSLINTSLTGINVLCYGESTGSIDLTVTGGITVYSYHWSNGSITEDLNNLPAGSYLVTVTDANGCTALASKTITQPSALLSISMINNNVMCNGTNTGSINMTVTGGTSPWAFHWSNNATTQNLNNINADTYYVTVTDANNCTGTGNAIITAPPALSISITGNGPTNGNNGSADLSVSGGISPYQYLWSDFMTTEDIGNLSAGTYSVTVTDYNGCIATGSVSIGNIASQQTLILPLGWSFFAPNVISSNMAINIIMAPIVQSLIIAKDDQGNVYWPLYGVNLIGNLIIGKGYQIKVSNSDTLIVSGAPIIPESIVINVTAGWSFIGYLRQSPAPIVTMLSNIYSYIIIAKDDQGNVYWPLYSVNLIGNMLPGKGYQIKTNAACSFNYPPNSADESKADLLLPEPEYFGKAIITGNSMTLGIINNGSGVTNGEIGVFSTDGLLVGSALVNGEFTALSLWGDDELTTEKDGLTENEPFIIKFRNRETGNEEIVNVNEWIEGNGVYQPNGISVAGSLELVATSNTQLYQNTPNPFKGYTEISFFLTSDNDVELNVFNAVGEIVATLCNNNLSSGMHYFRFYCGDLPSGVYFYRLKTNDYRETKAMNISK